MKNTYTNSIIKIILALLIFTQSSVFAKGNLIELDLIKQPVDRQQLLNRLYREFSHPQLEQQETDKIIKQINHKHNNDKQNKQADFPSFENSTESSSTNQTQILEQLLRNIQNNQYIVNLYIGSQSVKQPLLIDTGSPYTLVDGVDCEKCHIQNSKNSLFDCSQSPTCKLNEKSTYELTFVQGKAQGLQVKDKVCLQSGLVQCTTNEFTFIDIYNISYSMQNIEADGILGLGVIKKNPTFSFVQQLFASGQIPEPSFSLYINDISFDMRYQKDISKLILGGVNMKYGVENQVMVYHNIANSEHWALNLDTVKFNDKNIKQKDSKIAIIDSGSSNIVLPREDYNYLLKILTNDLHFICQSYNNIYLQCSCPTGEIGNFPEVKIKFSGVDSIYVLSPKDYIIQQNHLCNMQISYYSSTDGSWILGDVFLRKYMSYFNIQKEQIGLILSNKKSLESREFLKDVMLILECILGSLFLGILVIYFIRMISGLKNAKDEELNFE
ncbi:hypothetical protein ABPG74_000868 [Tetrahymena malaccensis]